MGYDTKALRAVIRIRKQDRQERGKPKPSSIRTCWRSANLKPLRGRE